MTRNDHWKQEGFAGARSKVLEAKGAVEYLHQVEFVGESAYTPALAIGGVLLLLTLAFTLLLAVTLAAYYLA